MIVLGCVTGIVTYYMGYGVGGSAAIGALLAVVGGGLWDSFKKKPTDA